MQDECNKPPTELIAKRELWTMQRVENKDRKFVRVDDWRRSCMSRLSTNELVTAALSYSSDAVAVVESRANDNAAGSDCSIGVDPERRDFGRARREASRQMDRQVFQDPYRSTRMTDFCRTWREVMRTNAERDAERAFTRKLCAIGLILGVCAWLVLGAQPTVDMSTWASLVGA
jgi:hypothetical protein